MFKTQNNQTIRFGQKLKRILYEFRKNNLNHATRQIV
jgi:hypothetical protein